MQNTAFGGAEMVARVKVTKPDGTVTYHEVPAEDLQVMLIPTEEPSDG